MIAVTLLTICCNIAYAVVDLDDSTKANLPAPGNIGNLYHVTDDAQGVWMDTGSKWVALNGEVKNVKELGAVGDGVTDDTTAIQNAINNLASFDVLMFPKGTYRITSGLTLRPQSVLIFNNATIMSEYGGAAITMNTRVSIYGRLIISCCIPGSNGVPTPGSIGIDYNAISCNISNTHLQNVHISYAETGVRFYSAGVYGAYENQIDKLATSATKTGVIFHTDNGGSTNYLNANRITFAAIQGCSSGYGLIMNGGDGNSFGYLECEGCIDTEGAVDGYAVYLQDCLGFTVDAGWLEGNSKNLYIGDYPAVTGVYITTSCDSSLLSVDTKFYHNYSFNRSVVVNGAQYKLSYGRDSFCGTVCIGSNLSPANDQNRIDRLQVAGGMYCYRHSVSNPYFYFTGGTGTGYLFRNAESTFFTADANLVDSYKKFRTQSEIEIDGALNHDGTTVGFFGNTPVTRPTIANLAAGADLATTVAKVNELLNYLRSRGDIQ